MAGLDEISTLGETKISELRDGKINNYIINPGDFEMKKANAKDLSGGDAGENAEILINILKGKEEEAKREVVVLNSASGIVAGGKANSIKEGVKLAEESIDSGSAYGKLEDMIAYG
jgi:anthranilate phosphoribosyltransferase